MSLSKSLLHNVLNLDTVELDLISSLNLLNVLIIIPIMSPSLEGALPESVLPQVTSVHCLCAQIFKIVIVQARIYQRSS